MEPVQAHFVLRRHDVHCRAHCRFADRLGIGSVVFLTVDEGLNVGRRDHTNLMAQLAVLAASEVGVAARLHRDDARRQLTEERQHLRSHLFYSQRCLTHAVSPIYQNRKGDKHTFRNVDPDCGDLRHDRPPLRILADSPWHINAVGGGHIIRAQIKRKLLTMLDLTSRKTRTLANP